MVLVVKYADHLPLYRDAELGRADLEPLRAILPDLVERAAAARATLVVEVTDDLDAGRWTARHHGWLAAWPRPRRAYRLASCFRRGRVRRGGLLHILQPEQQLILGQRLGATTEATALHRLDDLFQRKRRPQTTSLAALLGW